MGLKELAITFGIAVLFSAFVLVTIDAVYQRPAYEKYCNMSQQTPMAYKTIPLQDNSNCTNIVQNESSCYNQGGIPKYDVDNKGCSFVTGCDFCNKAYDLAQKEYTNNMFIILAIIGALAIIGGVYYKIEFLGTGFMFSGIFLMFFGTVQNFNELNKWTRPIVLLLELGLILFIAYKKVVQRETPKKKELSKN